MSDLIDRQAAIAAIEFDITYAKSINKETGEVTVMFEKENKALENAVTRIKRLPSAQPKKGKWIIKDDTEKFIAQCNCCRYIEDSRRINNFCPHCGANMKGKKK